MEIRTRCMICGDELARFSCHRCGSLVCSRCYDKNKKACISCSIGKI